MSNRLPQRGWFCLIAILALGSVSLSCAGHSSPDSKGASATRTSFEPVQRALEKENYKDGAVLAWKFLRTRQPADEDYENAEFVLARSLDRLGFSHAAMEYYGQVVRHGAASELIGESLGSVLQTMDKHSYDHYFVEIELLSSSEFEFLPKDLGDSVRFVRGKVDFQRGDVDWAKEVFARIDPETLPGLKVQYALGVQELKDGKPDQALLIFETVAEKAPAKTQIRNRAFQSIGRILYEQKKYKEALTAYEKIDSSVLLWNDIFLEKAWNTYQLGIYDRALGYLHALHAPIFKTSFQPERYLLLGMVLRRLCRYPDVHAAIDTFREKFGSAVSHIRSGRSLDKSPLIEAAARTKHLIRADGDFYDRLEKERKNVAESTPRSWKSAGLRTHLQRLYDLKRREFKSALRDKQENALEEVAEELLYYNEQVNLLEYEIRMDAFRRSHFSDPQPPDTRELPKTLVTKVIHWPYKGEFWIDELDQFTVKVESQCE